MLSSHVRVSMLSAFFSTDDVANRLDMKQGDSFPVAFTVTTGCVLQTNNVEDRYRYARI